MSTDVSARADNHPEKCTIRAVYDLNSVCYYSNMKQTHKHNRFTLNRYTVGVLAILIIAVVTCSAVALEHNTTEAAPSVRPATVALKSQFSFTGTSGWWQGATNNTSMALFHNAEDCFTSVEYKAGTVDVAAELQKTQTLLTSEGYTVTPGNIQTLSLQMGAGGKPQYQLHQYAVTGARSAGRVEGGQEYGYLQLPNGYVKIEGNCDNSQELAATVPALQAVKFDESN